LSQLIPAGLLLALAFYLGCFELADYDFWWHVRTGQLIGERGIPMTDWFSFTSEENTWIDVQWAFQLGIAALYHAIGIPGLVLCKAIIGTAVVFVALLARRSGWPVELQLSVWLPALLLMSSRFYVRPEILTLLFTAAYLTVLFHAERRPGLLWLLPLIQVAWANVHGLFVFGPILLAMYLVEALLRIDRQQGVFRHLMPTTLLVGVACIVSPYGWANVLLIPELWLKMSAEGRLYRETVAELESVGSFIRHGGGWNPYIWLLIGLLALAAISVVTAWRSILKDRRAFRVLALLAFGWLSLQATRNGNHFALVAGVVIGWNLAESRIWPALHVWVGGMLSSLTILAVGVFVVSGRWYLITDQDRRFGIAERREFISHDGMELAGSPGMPERAAVFHFGHAAAFIYHNGPEQKVFFDGRLELHSTELYQHYLELERDLQTGTQWDARLQAWGVGLLLIDGEYGHAMQAAVFNHPAWRCIHFDNAIAVFLRSSHSPQRFVNPWDPVRALFDGPGRAEDYRLSEPTSPPRWILIGPDDLLRDHDDMSAARRFQLGWLLAHRPDSDPTLRDAVLWQSARASLRAVRRRPWSAETFRYFGAALEALALASDADHGSNHATKQWDATSGLVPAMSIVALQRALACDADDATANLLLCEAYARYGALQSSLAPLERLSRRRAVNRALVQSQANAPQLIAERRRLLADAQANVKLPLDASVSFSDLERAARAGIIDEGLARFRFEPSVELSADQIDRVGTWLLSLGRVNDAAAVYESAAAQTHLTPARIAARLGCCAQAVGRYADALRHYERAAQADAKFFEPWFGLAILHLLAGDRPSLESALGHAAKIANAGNQRAAVQRLERMLERSPR
jgi:tetratricopeptide (TPR) repeat protein